MKVEFIEMPLVAKGSGIIWDTRNYSIPLCPFALHRLFYLNDFLLSSNKLARPINPWRKLKWFHVVFNLNSFLCRCIERQFVKGISNQANWTYVH